MKAEESRYIQDEFGVKRLIRGGRVIPAQWEDAYEEGEPAPERDKAQAAPDVDKAQKQADTTKAGKPSLAPATGAASRRRK